MRKNEAHARRRTRNRKMKRAHSGRANGAHSRIRRKKGFISERGKGEWGFIQEGEREMRKWSL